MWTQGNGINYIRQTVLVHHYWREDKACLTTGEVHNHFWLPQCKSAVKKLCLLCLFVLVMENKMLWTEYSNKTNGSFYLSHLQWEHSGYAGMASQNLACDAFGAAFTDLIADISKKDTDLLSCVAILSLCTPMKLGILKTTAIFTGLTCKSWVRNGVTDGQLARCSTCYHATRTCSSFHTNIFGVQVSLWSERKVKGPFY